jgi:predicted transcriptional regulator
MRFTRITLARVDYKPRTRPDVNEELQCLGSALGLFGLRDKDRSRFRIFITLLKAGRALTSDELADALDLTRATVIHHLDSLMDAGIVENVRGGYALRVDNLEELITAIKQDVDKTFDELMAVAKNVDRELGLPQPRRPAKSETFY